MNYLRYSSDEMFSSTELIRKSKKIFDKLNKKEIEKAIILRDGKPGFMLLDFETYEKTMKEYEKLKSQEIKKNSGEYLSLEDIEINTKTKIEKINIKEADAEIDLNVVSNNKKVSDEVEIKNKVIEIENKEITDIEQITTPEIDDEELLRALEEIDKMNITEKKEDVNKSIEGDLNLEAQNLDEKQNVQPLKEFWDK